MALDAGATQASVLFAVVIAGLSWQLWSLQHAVVRPVDSFVSKLKATAATVVAGSEGAGGGSSTASLCDFATARMSHVMAKAVLATAAEQAASSVALAGRKRRQPIAHW